MGIPLSLFQRLRPSKQVKLLLVGLDGSGKTTLLYKLKLGELVATIPTAAFNIESIEHKGINFSFWDVAGKDELRPLWKHYYANTNGIVFVIDSNDRDRIEEAHNELKQLMSEEVLKGADLLVLANKQDLPNAMKSAEIAERLQLNDLKSRKWHIQSSCAPTGEGLYYGLDWFVNSLKE